MSHYELELTVAGPKHMARDYFEDLVDEIADAVADLADGIDGDVSAAHNPQLITIHLSLDDESDEGAISRGMAAARTVFHTIGWSTPGWEALRVQRESRHDAVAL